MTGTILNTPREMRAFLAQRAVLDPADELRMLLQYLDAPELSRLQGRARVDMLEAMWPSIDALLNVFERQLAGSLARSNFEENASFTGFEQLAHRTAQLYIEAAVSLHRQTRPWWGEYPREIALVRGIDLSVRLALTRLAFYLPFEAGFWHRFYTLWREATHAKVLNTPAISHSRSISQRSIGQVLIGLALLATLPTNALPAQEIRPLLACFVHFSSTEQLSTTPPREEAEWVAVYFEHDLPPRRLKTTNHDDAAGNNIASLYIHVEPLVRSIETMLSEFSGDFIYINECAVLISRATLERVVHQLKHPVKQRRERPKASGECHVYCGLSTVHHLLREGIQLGHFASFDETEWPKLIQEGIDTLPDETNLLQNTVAPEQVEETWEQVGRGHLIIDLPTQEDATHAASISAPSPSAASTAHQSAKPWKMMDVSVDGIRLRSEQASDNASISVGDIVLVEFSSAISIDYMIGILRWEKRLDALSREIGIETLTHTAQPLRISGNHQNTAEWHDALVLPTSRTSSQPLLILPNQNYRTGASVMVLLPHAAHEDGMQRDDTMREYILGHKILQTASVCGFQFRDALEQAALDTPIDDNLDVTA